MKPIAFMVMPFGTKDTDQETEGVPSEVDFDALWSKVYYPVLEEHYTPVRADEDFGASILVDMIQRLAAADVVVADISIPNANVYYEVGVRHAARNGGCVLVAADWSQTPFDLAQVRRLQYPLPEGAVPDDVASAARDSLRSHLPEAAAKGDSPVFTAVPNFPEHDPSTLEAFRDFARRMSDFHASVREVALAPAAERRQRGMALAARHRGPLSKGVAWELIVLLRDHVGWEETSAFIEGLDPSLREAPEIREQHWLAVSGTKDHARAAAQLEELITVCGATPERCGLLGGRYKRLATAASARGDEAESASHLNAAVAAYQRGMQLDLNEYYCSSNLPRLLRLRDETDDAHAAERAEVVTRNACERALERGEGDEWLRPTFLNVAFDIGDVTDAQRLANEVRREGHATWKLQTCIDDLRVSAEQHPEPTATALRAVVDELASLLPES